MKDVRFQNRIASALSACLTLALLAGAAASAADDAPEDFTQLDASVIDLEPPKLPLDTLAPPVSFVPPDGDKLWGDAKQRALNESLDRPGGIIDFSKMVDESFRSAVNLNMEVFATGEKEDTLQQVIKAKDCVRDGKFLRMTQMRMTYLMPDAPPAPDAAGAPMADAKKTAPPKPSSNGMMSFPPGSRVLIRAPKCDIDLDTNEGYAWAPEGDKADMEIYPKPEPGKELKPMIVITSAFMRWRSWNDAGTGSTEIVMYTCGRDPNEADPVVNVWISQPQDDGSVANTTIVGNGMIFESGQFEHPTPVYDEEGRTAGLSQTSRSRAIFHQTVSTEMLSAVTASSLLPSVNSGIPGIQGNVVKDDAAKSADDAKKAARMDPKRVAKQQQQAEDPYKTVIFCNGPVIFDMAHVPKQKYTPVTDLTSADTVDLGELKPVEMGKRYDFLNNVKMDDVPVTLKPDAVDLSKHMTCLHLRVQYPPALPAVPATPAPAADAGAAKTPGVAAASDKSVGDKTAQPKVPDDKAPADTAAANKAPNAPPPPKATGSAMPGGKTPPEYAEAIGGLLADGSFLGVKMWGYNQPDPDPDPTKPPEPPQPFLIECKRTYLDSPNDCMYLVGPEGKLDKYVPIAYVKNPSGSAYAQQFCYRTKTQTMTMPSVGRKKMIMHSTTPAQAATPATATTPAPGTTPPAATTPAGGGMLGGGDTIMTWSGPLFREIRRVPVTHKKDEVKEVLRFNSEVTIEQPANAMKIFGEHVRLHRDVETQLVEYMFAEKNVDVSMNDVRALGDIVIADTAYELQEKKDEKGDVQKDEKGEPIKEYVKVKDNVTVLGNHKLGIKADCFRGGGNAIRTEKLIMDQKTGNFTAWGGAVAVMKPDTPPVTEPKPEEAKGAQGIVGGLDSSKPTWIQCDGLFVNDAVKNLVTADVNVLIRQVGLNLKTNYVRMEMEAAPPAKPADPNAPKTPDAPKSAAGANSAKALADSGAAVASADKAASGAPKADGNAPPAPPSTPPPAQQSSGSFFNGELKLMQCWENVEMVKAPAETPTIENQFIQCDTMTFDAKTNVTFMEMDDPEDDVRIYSWEEDGTTNVLCSRTNLRLEQNTGLFTPAGQIMRVPFKEDAPAPRGKDSSPARRKAK